MFKAIFQKISLLIFASTLVGCGSYYKAPLGEDVANILISTPSFNGFTSVTLTVYPNYSCNDYQILEVLHNPSSPPFRTTAQPGEVLVIEFEFVNSKPDFAAGGSILSSLGKRTVAFIPEPSTQYEIGYSSDKEPVVYEISSTKIKIDSTPKTEC